MWQVRHLAASCSVLDPAALATGSSTDPLHRALRAYVVRNSGTFTYVLQASDGGAIWHGFVQAENEQRASAWRITCLAPRIQDCAHAPTVWYRLLLHLCIAAGERHVQRLFACVEQDSAEEQVLRQAGFAPYCHDSVWVRTGNRTQLPAVSARVRPARTQDAWGIQRLSVKVTPRHVRQAEGLGENGNGGELSLSNGREGQFVLVGRQDEIAGWAAVSHPGAAYRLRLMVDPDEREGATDLILYALASVSATGSYQVVCALRDYQPGVSAVLGENGFERKAERSLLVKNTTVQVTEARRKLVPALEKRAGVVPTAPHCQGRSEARCKWQPSYTVLLGSERDTNWRNW